MKKSILKGIYDAVNSINWKTPTLKYNALLFCETLFNNHCYNEIPFNNYYSMPINYIKTFIPNSNYRVIVIKELTKNNIIQVDNNYSNNKDNKSRIISCKKYKFNYNLINKKFNELNYIIYVSPSKIIDSINVSNDKNSDFNTNFIVQNTQKMLQNISINNDIQEKIDNYIFDKNQIILNEDIKDDKEYYKLFINGEKYNEENNTIAYAKKCAKNLSMDLILYKDKLYIDILDNFIQQKQLQWKLINKLKVFDLQNGIYRANINTTNNRLDTNITNFPKTLLDSLLFKKEPFIEIDIKNSQFAFLCYITNNLDKNFIKLCQTGELYEYIQIKLNIKRLEAKQLMFEIAFGKRQLKNQSPIYKLFPKTMKWIDDYKQQNGYKAFSNLLQITESNIMIQGLLNYLYLKGYEVLSVHDSIRTNKSIEKIIKKEIKYYFKSIKFKCDLSDK